MKNAPQNLELWAVAIHEAAHRVVAEALGYTCEAVATETQGLALHHPTRSLPHFSAVAWAGLVAQAMVGATTAKHPTPGASLADETQEWVCEALAMSPHNPEHDLHLFKARSLSVADALVGVQLARRKLEIFMGRLVAEAKALYSEALARGTSDAETVSRFRERIERERAEAVEAEYRRREAALLAEAIPRPPDGFPATWSDFARVIARGSTLDFVRHEAARHGFTGCASDRGCEMLLEGWALLDKESWAVVVRSYRDWAESAGRGTR